MRVRTLIGPHAGQILDVPMHAYENGKASGFYLEPEDPRLPIHVPLPADDPVLNMAQVEAARMPIPNTESAAPAKPRRRKPKTDDDGG